MKSDLERLMVQRGIGAIVAPMHESLDSSFRWLSNGAKVTRGYVLKVVGREPVLLSYPMERDEAAASGLQTLSIHDFGYHDLFKKLEPSTAYATFYARVFERFDVLGTVAFVGSAPLQLYFPLLEELEELGWKVYRSPGDDLIQRARKRKDARELQLIRSVGERTEAVVGTVRDMLRTTTINEGIAQLGGEPLTLGHLKRRVTTEIQRLGMIEDHETILSQGRDAGIPHSRGDADAFVRASQPIVLDIFPADRESGYFFDLTRTFCVGPIPERLATIHDHVLSAHALAAKEMHADTLAATYQKLVCDFLEEKGHPTIQSNPQTTSGYVHSLGHGVGLQVHERPTFSANESMRDLVEVGDVLTIEPGLYYPEEEIGVRIEDTFFIDENGKAVSFSVSDRGLRP